MASLLPPGFSIVAPLSIEREALADLLLRRLKLLISLDMDLDMQYDLRSDLITMGMLLVTFRNSPNELEWILSREVELFEQRVKASKDPLPLEAWHIVPMAPAEVVKHGLEHQKEAVWVQVPIEGAMKELRGEQCAAGVVGCSWNWIRKRTAVVAWNEDGVSRLYSIYRLMLDRFVRSLSLPAETKYCNSFFRVLLPLVRGSMTVQRGALTIKPVDHLAQQTWNLFQQLGPMEFFEKCVPFCMRSIGKLYWTSTHGHARYHDRMTLVRFFYSLRVGSTAASEMYISMFLTSKSFREGGWTIERVDRHPDYGRSMVKSMEKKCDSNLWCTSVRSFSTDCHGLCPFMDIEDVNPGDMCGTHFQQRFPGKWPTKQKRDPVTSPSQYTRAAVYYLSQRSD